MTQREIDKLATALRFTLGGTAVAAGADKFFNLLTEWEKYLSPVVTDNIPMSTKNFMRLVGVVEMAVGAGILMGYERPAGYVCSAWLLAIVGNLLSRADYFDIAARDVNMALEAFVLARLAGMKSATRTASGEMDEGDHSELAA